VLVKIACDKFKYLGLPGGHFFHYTTPDSCHVIRLPDDSYIKSSSFYKLKYAQQIITLPSETLKHIKQMYLVFLTKTGFLFNLEFESASPVTAQAIAAWNDHFRRS